MIKARQVDILLVEDNPGDVRLTMEALKECKLEYNIHVVMNGVQAMECLHRAGIYENVPKPGLILLDLNLPIMDGRDVLEEIKKDKHLRRIPVVVFTTSRAEEDIMKSYNLHANCYINKPVDLYSFAEVIKAIETFWMTVAILPPDEVH